MGAQYVLGIEFSIVIVSTESTLVVKDITTLDTNWPFTSTVLVNWKESKSQRTQEMLQGRVPGIEFIDLEVEFDHLERKFQHLCVYSKANRGSEDCERNCCSAVEVDATGIYKSDRPLFI